MFFLQKPTSVSTRNPQFGDRLLIARTKRNPLPEWGYELHAIKGYKLHAIGGMNFLRTIGHLHRVIPRKYIFPQETTHSITQRGVVFSTCLSGLDFSGATVPRAIGVTLFIQADGDKPPRQPP